MNLITGGEVVVDCLRKQGVKKVFSIIGGQMGSMYEAIGRSDDIDLFVPRCETTVPLMACGYTASTGEPAVSMTTVGAGVVYEVGGLMHAWLNYLPVISIAPQVQGWKTKPHQESLQACNQDEIFAPLTKWNTIIYHWRRIPQMVIRGFREAYTGVPGPVHIDVPVDVLFKRGPWGVGRLKQVPVVNCETVISGVTAQIEAAAAVLNNAERSLVIVGQGIGRMGRYRGVRELLNNLGVPVVTTRFSSGIMGGSDGAYAGAAGSLFAETPKGMALLKDADTVVVIGIDPETNSLIEKCGWASKPIIQIETESSAILSFARYPVHADPVSALSAIIASGISAAKSKGWLDTFQKVIPELTRELFPTAKGINRVIALLGEKTDSNDIIVADGVGISAATANIMRGAEYRDLFCMDERDMLGVGLPFAIGAALGNPNARVTLICDKESLFAHVRELSPATQAGIALRIIVADAEDAQVNCADTASVLEGFGCTVKKNSANDAVIEIPEFRPKAMTALVIKPM